MMRKENSDDGEDEEMEDEGEAMDAPLSDKVNKIYGHREERNSRTASVAPSALTIPKLDLAKALRIQEMNAKKSTMQQLQKQ